MCQANGRVGWGPPSYLKKACGNESDSDSEDDYVGLQEYLGLPGACKSQPEPPPLSISPPPVCWLAVKQLASPSLGVTGTGI